MSVTDSTIQRVKENDMKRTLSIAAFLLASVAAAGSVYAAIPSADGVISACKGKDGSIKLIDTESGQTCNGNQQLVEWNQEGPQGPAGDGGVANYVIVHSESAANSTGDKTVWAFCTGGRSVIGGGAGVYGTTLAGGGQVIIDGVALVQNHPVNESGWGARADEFIPTDEPWILHVWAICADAS